MLLSQAGFTSHSPSYGVTTEGDRHPEELEPFSRQWFSRPLAHVVFCPDVHILATPAVGMDGATSGDPIVPLCTTAIIHVKRLWNTWQELVQDLLFYVSFVTDVASSTQKNITLTAGVLNIDLK